MRLLKNFSIAIFMAIFVLLFSATGSEAAAQGTKTTPATKTVKQCRFVKVPVVSKRTGKTRKVRKCNCTTTAANAKRAKQLDNREAALKTRSSELDDRESAISIREGAADNLENRLAGLEKKIADRETAVTNRETAATTKEADLVAREADLTYWWSWLPYAIAVLVLLFILAIILANHAGRNTVRRRYADGTETVEETDGSVVPKQTVKQQTVVTTEKTEEEGISDETELKPVFRSSQPVNES